MQFGTVEQAIEDIKAGKMIIVADDEDRENEGDLICAAQLVTPELINFMIRKAGGWICLALTGERADQLDLPQQSETNSEEYRTAFRSEEHTSELQSQSNLVCRLLLEKKKKKKK